MSYAACQDEASRDVTDSIMVNLICFLLTSEEWLDAVRPMVPYQQCVALIAWLQYNNTERNGMSR